MRAISFYHPAVTFAATLFLGLGFPAFALPAKAQPPTDQSVSGQPGEIPRTATFQPLNDPATGEQHPGKMVWADLFTTDPVTATKFYCGLFGWTATATDQKGKAYTVFNNAGHPVAGLVARSVKNPRRPSRWISYISVPDIKSALVVVTEAGGKIHAPARDFPDRGLQAIIADNDGASVGLLQSSSGDSVDDEPAPGEWNWFELYAKEPKTTSAFYGRVFNYAVKSDTRTERKNDYLLSSDDLPRAGVAPLPDREDASVGWLGVVRVTDIEASLARATALGGEILLPTRATAYESRFAIIADPTGGAVGLIEYVDNANPATRP